MLWIFAFDRVLPNEKNFVSQVFIILRTTWQMELFDLFHSEGVTATD